MSAFTRVVFLVFCVGAGLSSFISVHAKVPKGWYIAGSGQKAYTVGLDSKIKRSGRSSATIRSKPLSSIRGFATLMQSIDAKKYRGKRLRFRIWIKNKNIRGYVGAWMRIDGANNKPLSFDNMQNRPIRGSSDWKQYDIVLDVSHKASHVAFGVLISGIGQVWMDDMKLEIVGKNVPVTNIRLGLPKKPVNPGFEPR